MSGLAAAVLLSVWERARHQAPLDRALILLSAVGAGGEEAAGWDLGSRDARLAAALEGLTGPTAWTESGCAGCGAVLDVPVDVTSLAVSPVRTPGERIRTTVDGAEVSFRLPTTADLQALSGADATAGRRILLARCTGLAECSEEVASAVESAMECASPAIAVEFVVGCPECGTTTRAALDVPALLWAEVRQRAVALLRDVHTLAAAYGWTEAQVLALSPARRAAYLELLGS